MKLPALSGNEVIKALVKAGFKIARRKGSHAILVKFIDGRKIGVVVPDHKEIDKGTLLEIIRQARLKKRGIFRIDEKIRATFHHSIWIKKFCMCIFFL